MFQQATTALQMLQMKLVNCRSLLTLTLNCRLNRRAECLQWTQKAASISKIEDPKHRVVTPVLTRQTLGDQSAFMPSRIKQIQHTQTSSLSKSSPNSSDFKT